MRKNRRTLWLATTALSLSAFSFAAGFGIRGLASLAEGRFSGSLAGRLATHTRFASAVPGSPDPDLRPAELYLDVYGKLKELFVDPLPSDTRLAEGSLETMLASLDDPNTRLLSAREWEALSQMDQGVLKGLGAVLTVRKYKHGEGRNPGTDRHITVVAPLPGSAAQKAGLQPGDRITYLDGHWIAPFHLSYRLLAQIEDDLGPGDTRLRLPEPPSEERPEPGKRREEELRWVGATDLNAAMEELLAGKAGEHELTVVRGGVEKPLKIKVTFADGQAALFSSRKINATTGYVRLAAFGPASAEELGKVLADFQREGIQNLVIDLRGSPGGSIETARGILGMLAPGSVAYVSRERDANRKLVDRKVNVKSSVLRFKPAALSVLVDRGSAGASEVLAAALKENLGARLVGSMTFGDGTEQQVVPLPNGAAVSITHAQMLSPKGSEIEGKGLKPDAPGGEGDAAIEAAVRSLGSATNRSSRPASAAVRTSRR